MDVHDFPVDKYKIASTFETVMMGRRDDCNLFLQYLTNINLYRPSSPFVQAMISRVNLSDWSQAISKNLRDVQVLVGLQVQQTNLNKADVIPHFF